MVRLITKRVSQYLSDGCTKSQNLKVCILKILKTIASPIKKNIKQVFNILVHKAYRSKDMNKGKKIPQTSGGTTKDNPRNLCFFEFMTNELFYKS